MSIFLPTCLKVSVPLPSAGVPTPGGPAGGGLPASSLRVPRLVNPFYFPPDEARFASDHSSASVAPAASAILAEFTLSDAEFARVYGLGMQIKGTVDEQLDGWEDTVWQILVNGVPDESYGDMHDQLSLAVDLTSVVVKVERNQSIKLKVTNNDAVNTYVCFGRLVFWKFPAGVFDAYLRGE